MDKFVLVRRDGKMVAKPGSHHSYTGDVRKAQLFDTRDKAESQRCPENEFIVSFADLFDSQSD